MTLARIIDFPEHGDERGMLVAIHEGIDVPFEVRRVYYMYGTKPGVRRGRHAHRDLRQVAIAVSGSCRFLLDDGRKTAEVLLDRPNRGLLIESMIWGEMFDFTDDCVLMVLANGPHDETDYVRDYEEFRKSVVERAR